MTSSRDLPFSKKPDKAALEAAERELDRRLIAASPPSVYSEPAKLAEAKRLLEIAVASLDDAGRHQTALLIRRCLGDL